MQEEYFYEIENPKNKIYVVSKVDEQSTCEINRDVDPTLIADLLAGVTYTIIVPDHKQTVICIAYTKNGANIATEAYVCLNAEEYDYNIACKEARKRAKQKALKELTKLESYRRYTKYLKDNSISDLKTEF